VHFTIIGRSLLVYEKGQQMRFLRNISLVVLALGVLSACTAWFGEKTSGDEASYDGCNAIIFGDDTASCSENGQCQTSGNVEKISLNDAYVLPPEVNVAGVKICPPKKRCRDDGRLPPQPCAQPMPQYYGNVSQEMIADGIVLIHPYTRTQVICLDMPGEGAANCAENFRAAGFVLITDIPQLPAKYDLLKEGTYPTRRWRGKGEVVPRW